MKRIFYILSSMLAITLASCNNEELGENTSSDTREVTVNAAPDYAMADGSAAPQTRGTATVDRYVMEVYENADYSTPANVFEGGTASRSTNATGSFTISLADNKDYYCLMWADKKANGAEVYTVTNLKNVSLISGAQPTEAFYGTLPIKGGKTEYSTLLHRAVANIVLKETGTLAAGTLNMKFSQPTTFDVSTAAPTGTSAERIETITFVAISGSVATPVQLNGTPIYILAPTASAVATDFIFKNGSNTEFTVSGANVQANYNTNLIGHFEEEPPVPVYYSVGDYYPDATNPIGIVFYINMPDENGKGDHGKIVSLDEPVENWNGGTNSVGRLSWSTEKFVTTATSVIDGAANTNTIKNLGSYSATVYPAAAWCLAKTTGGKSWYLPAINELKQLYAAMCGLRWIPVGETPGPDEIEHWASGSMPNNSNYSSARTAFNEKFGVVSGIPMTLTDYYCSSTEFDDKSAYDIRFTIANALQANKAYTDRVRAIATF